MMRSFEKISTEELLRSAESRPETLHETKALEELAHRATRGDAPVEIVAQIVVGWCSDENMRFGGPPGFLAASVLASASVPVKEVFWRIAHQMLSTRSLDTLHRFLGEGLPNRELNEDPLRIPALNEALSVRLLCAGSSHDVETAVRNVMPKAVLVEELTAVDFLEWFFNVPPPVDLRMVLEIAAEVARATQAACTCNLPARYGALGPDVVAYYSPGGTPAIGMMRTKDDGALAFDPIDLALLVGVDESGTAEAEQAK